MFQNLMARCGRLVLRSDECKGKVVVRFSPFQYRLEKRVDADGDVRWLVVSRNGYGIVCWIHAHDPFVLHNNYSSLFSQRRKVSSFDIHPGGVDGRFLEMLTAMIMVMAPFYSWWTERVVVKHVGPAPSINPYNDPVLGHLLDAPATV